MPKKLLLIEDDNDIRTFYETFLKAHGYDTTVCLDGEEGWSKITADGQVYDCILLDIMMPKLDGLGFLKRKAVNEKVKNTPVVMITNMGNDELMKECYNLGAKFFILKAEIDPQKIPLILEQAIASKSQIPNPNVK